MIRRRENNIPPGKMRHFSRRCGVVSAAVRTQKTGSSRAFTLLELVVVVAVMGIILMMGIPAIKSAFRRDPLTQAVVDFTTACQGSMGHQGARSLAILKGKEMELRIYPQEKRIEVGEVNSGNGADAGTGSAEALADAEPKPAVGTPFSAQISDRVSFKMLDVNFIDVRDADVATVRFYPNGTSDDFNVILVSDDGEARRITLDIVTGLPQVESLR
jgi:prepilin-type N-terminal cleavage/methylation domain-containing protein